MRTLGVYTLSFICFAITGAVDTSAMTVRLKNIKNLFLNMARNEHSKVGIGASNMTLRILDKKMYCIHTHSMQCGYLFVCLLGRINV